jgi:hypothetical protein
MNPSARTTARNKQSGGQKEAIAQALLMWQPRASSRLDAENARQAIENIAGFFATLNAWDTAETVAGLEGSNVTAISPEAVNEPLNRKIENAA